jgi:hypothetical protein
MATDQRLLHSVDLDHGIESMGWPYVFRSKQFHVHPLVIYDVNEYNEEMKLLFTSIDGNMYFFTMDGEPINEAKWHLPIIHLSEKELHQQQPIRLLEILTRSSVSLLESS